MAKQGLYAKPRRFFPSTPASVGRFAFAINHFKNYFSGQNNRK
jgi:hypothetical protein